MTKNCPVGVLNIGYMAIKPNTEGLLFKFWVLPYYREVSDDRKVACSHIEHLYAVTSQLSVNITWRKSPNNSLDVQSLDTSVLESALVS